MSRNSERAKLYQNPPVLILGIETSCDETGVALYDAAAGRLLGHVVHSQVEMHQAYGGVVPELASRDHVRRLVPLARGLLARTGREVAELGAIAYTQGPGLVGALLVGASFAHALAAASAYRPSASITSRATCCRPCSRPAGPYSRLSRCSSRAATRS